MITKKNSISVHNLVLVNFNELLVSDGMALDATIKSSFVYFHTFSKGPGYEYSVEAENLMQLYWKGRWSQRS